MTIADIHASAGDEPYAKIGGYRLISEFACWWVDRRSLEMPTTTSDAMSPGRWVAERSFC